MTDLDKRYGLENEEGNISGPARTLEEAKQVGKDIMAAHRPKCWRDDMEQSVQEHLDAI
ncbi:hypothetical protein D3C76_401030 [compost metagenome]